MGSFSTQSACQSDANAKYKDHSSHGIYGRIGVCNSSNSGQTKYIVGSCYYEIANPNTSSAKAVYYYDMTQDTCSCV